MPARSLNFSKEVLSLADDEKRRIVLEGIVFRTRQNLEGLFPGSPPDQVLLSGGLSREPFLAPGMRCLSFIWPRDTGRTLVENRCVCACRRAWWRT